MSGRTSPDVPGPVRPFDTEKVDLIENSPLIGFAANSDAVKSFDKSESLDVIASHYDLFLVVTAQIERDRWRDGGQRVSARPKDTTG